jgi:hypothetical protein
LWGEVPDTAALGGATLIFVATLMCLSRDKAAPEAA